MENIISKVSQEGKTIINKLTVHMMIFDKQEDIEKFYPMHYIHEMRVKIE